MRNMWKLGGGLMVAALLSVSAAAAEKRTEDMTETPTLAFFKLIVADMEKMESFYADALGLKRMNRYDLPTIEEVIMGQDGLQFGLVLYRDKSGAPIEMGSGHGPVGFRVKDVDAAAKRLVEAGAELTQGPFAFGPSRIAFLNDPEGHPLELISMGDAQ